MDNQKDDIIQRAQCETRAIINLNRKKTNISVHWL